MEVKNKLKKTKIICTLGPATKDDQVFSEMLKNGMDIARVNFSHGCHSEKNEIFEQIKRMRKVHENLFFGVAMDTQGPEVRLELKKSIQVTKDDILTFCNQNGCGDDHVHFNFNNIKELKPGSQFFVDDGALKFVVAEVEKHRIKARACIDHLMINRKSINFPGIPLGVQFMSQKDKDDIKFACEKNVNYIFASFVSSKDDVLKIKDFVDENCRSSPLIIAKIESVEGINNIKEILEVADGIMIARGDLYAEVGYEKLLSTQKYLSVEAKKAKKPLIIATEMIESMIDKTTPTRTEITDIGNAVLDGADCIMTSAETAVGKHPALVVQTMKNIVLDAEQYAEKYINTKIVNTELHKIKWLTKVDRSGSHPNYEVTGIVIETHYIEYLQRLTREEYNLPIFCVMDYPYHLSFMSIYKGVYPVLKPDDNQRFWGSSQTSYSVKLMNLINELYGFGSDMQYPCILCDETKEIFTLVELHGRELENSY